MTDLEKKREEIAEIIYFDCTYCPYKGEGDCITPKNCKYTYDKADEILSLFDGYVKLADDQTPPECPISEVEATDALYNHDSASPHWARNGYLEAQQDMLTPKDGTVWKKVRE